MAVPVARATLLEIEALLADTPAAPKCWADVLYAAGLPLAGVAKLLETMMGDPDSPLREAAEGVLNAEIAALVAERGQPDEGVSQERGVVPIKNCLSPSEQTRVLRMVNHFCTPVFKPNRRFGHSGHPVANAVRRAAASYLKNKIPAGAGVLEVGPDVVDWLTSPSPPAWRGDVRNYVGARPNITPRDVVRADWGQIAELAKAMLDGFWEEQLTDKAKALLADQSGLFPNAKVEDVDEFREYILSNDANYDVRFDSMPLVMSARRARAWHGVMLRVKGLSRVTRQRSGVLENMGFRWKADWERGVIKFSHAQCAAFGYTHNLEEYLKYEENAVHVWESRRAHYIYTKGPETNDELLFFSVYRVPKATYFHEPSFVEVPDAGKLEVQSIWAVGDELDGVPKTFEPVRFVVEELAFSKVLEKRRALGHKADIAVTLQLVRGTSVRFWLNGTPVGVTQKLHQSVAEAMAVAVEVMVYRDRTLSNRTFDKAMEVFRASIKRESFFVHLLSQFLDLRALVGSVAKTITNVWDAIRVPLADGAIADVAGMEVVVRRIPQHVQVPGQERVPVVPDGVLCTSSLCVCGVLRDVAEAMAVADSAERELLGEYLDQYLPDRTCVACDKAFDDYVVACAPPERPVDVDADTSSSSGDTSSASSVTGGTSDTSVSCTDDESCVEVDSPPRAVTMETRAMQEFVELNQFLHKAELSEVRVDAARIWNYGYFSDRQLEAFSTSRVKHYVLEFFGGRCVGSWGPRFDKVGAIYDVQRDRLVPVRVVDNVMRADVHDGRYYSCSRLRVCNRLELCAAVSHALDEGNPAYRRSDVAVTFGVPGAGKTYTMMQEVAAKYKGGQWPVLVLSVTRAGVAAAKKYGVKFGIPLSEIEQHAMTIDSYLMHKKTRYRWVRVDEFPMEHMGKVDAAMAMSWAVDMRWYGDYRQIVYDSFQREFPTPFANFDEKAHAGQIQYLCETHRLAEDVCAMWLDMYPAIYPCRCCDRDKRPTVTLSARRLTGMTQIPINRSERLMTFTQDERATVHDYAGFSEGVEACRQMQDGGLATVHEDQGSTHKYVRLIRVNDVWDKNASSLNPSLYNRLSYVLTATTRHVEGFVYDTLSTENDLVLRRIELSRDPRRRALVRARQGLPEAERWRD